MGRKNILSCVTVGFRKEYLTIFLVIPMLIGCFGGLGGINKNANIRNDQDQVDVKMVKRKIGDGIVEFSRKKNGGVDGEYYLVDTVNNDTVGKGFFINEHQSGEWVTQYKNNDIRCIRHYINGVVQENYECEQISSNKRFVGKFDFAGLDDSTDVGKLKIDSSMILDTLANRRSKSAIMQIIKTETPKMRFIYNQYLRKRPGFVGEITIKFTIDRDGIIRWSKIVNSTTNYAEFDNAILREVCSFIYPRILSGVTTVTIPWTFLPM
jgi:TonB family protein